MITGTHSGTTCSRLLPITACAIIALTAASKSKAQDSPASLTSQGAGSGLIILSVSVTDDHGRIVTKLSKDRFTLVDDKSPQEIKSFEETDVPFSIGFLLDTSGSMQQPNNDLLAVLKDKILRFITQSHKANEYFVLTFGKNLQLLTDWTRDISVVGDVLDKLAANRPQGPTSLYDACYQAIEKVRAGSNPRRALILVTDGQDNVSHHTYQAVRELLKQSDVLIYAVFKADLVDDFLAGYGREVLKELTSISGGAGFVPYNKAGIGQVFDSIASEMQHQYLIGFSPTRLDRKWHAIKIKVTPLEVPNLSNPNKPRKRISLSARTRQGFYATHSSH